MLLKPKEIEIESYVADEDEIFKFRIGRYDGYNGLDLIEYVTEIAKTGFNITGETKKGVLKECLKRMGHYIEAIDKDDKGKTIYVPLNTELALQTYLTNVEVSMKLMIELHDYNTFFLSTESLLTTSTSWIQKLEKLVIETLMKSLDISSVQDTQQ